jgi:hypothetical protein
VLDVLQEPLDVLVDDNFEWDVTGLRASFVTSVDEAWALKFANSPAFERFLQKYNKASFENRFGQAQNDDTVAKVGSQTRKFRGGSDSSLQHNLGSFWGVCSVAEHAAQPMRP